MVYQDRPYQTESIASAIDFFREKKLYNGLQILPTGSGKSLIVARIASAIESLPGDTLIFQPSIEILQQNFLKFQQHGGLGSIYSAKAGIKIIGKTTFVTIGSVYRKKHLFKNVTKIIIDECHLVNSEAGMYESFIRSLPGVRVLGLTATPYRLSSSLEGSMLKFLTRTRPKIFNKVLYYVQNDVLFNQGYLAKLRYFDVTVIDRSKLMLNKSGSDFDEASLRRHMREIDMPTKAAHFAERLLKERKNLLIFCASIWDAERVASQIPGAAIITGETETTTRANILKMFKTGVIRCVVNVGVLIVGFDYPELEAILIARPTSSLAVYYQMVGRVMRISKQKADGWVVDLGGNIKFFGKIETMKVVDSKGLFSIWNVIPSGMWKQLTNVLFTKN